MMGNAIALKASPIWASSLAVSSSEEHWFAAYTCANHEKRAAAHLEARGVEHFLPLYSSVSRWKDRRAQLTLPLFPGYLFVRLASQARLRVLEVPGVVRLVGFNGQPYPLPDSEVESLRAGVRKGMLLQPHPYLNIGSRVRIKTGWLGGTEGILIRKKNTYRVVISLNLISRSASVEVDAADIERIT
jgi:transcription antitermination factor NusG